MPTAAHQPDDFAFHPAVERWFGKHFPAPTPVQAQSWPAIARGEHTLLAAPTGSGKTLAAFMASIDALVREGLDAALPNEARVLYISPLKALSNDIQKNLQVPLAGIRDCLLESGLPDVDVQAWVRTGDTPQAERARAAKNPPHILVTTPESAYILLTSESGRQMLKTVRTVIVDEIHALAGNKRGAHLALTLERLDALTEYRLTRVGCSATQKPIEDMARFLIGDRDEPCNIIDTGHVRERDLALTLTASPLEAIMPNEVWEEVYNSLAAQVHAHTTTLVFVNTRRLAERVAKHLGERIGEEHVTSHHGSLAKEHRLRAEQRLKAGELKCLVATASLELGIDIGDIDLVCQLGTPRAIAAFLQRVGRSGHSIGQIPKGRLYPLSRDDLVECTALLGAANRGELDRIAIPSAPLDVLAQQIVAEVAGCEEWDVAALYDVCCHAWPYRELTRDRFDAVLQMLADGYSTRRGRRGAYLHLDAVNGKVRARRGARLTALTNGGAIPDMFDFDVFMLPESIKIGTLNEDFAVESLPGDIFQLGNTSYRILKVETGKVWVEDAKGQPPNLPFWFGEAPGRSDELSRAVSGLRAGLDKQLAQGMSAAEDWIRREYGIDAAATAQLVHYLAAARAAFGMLPTQEKIVFERFFDETGDMHLVIHSPYGSRLNRAWGLALRKRFCRKFNFELQAAALEDCIIISLSESHSFPIDEPASYLKSATVRDVLVQALIDAPMFPTHWRWTASIALAIKRNHNGRRAPPYFQRNDAEDLMAAVFPDQIACAENITGRREIPDHPLVTQAIDDCLHDLMDIEALEALLRRREAGEIDIIGRELTEPSPLASEILGARPYAFLDDAPAEERRALAVQSRRFIDPVDAAELGRLDAAAIERVKREAWPECRNADELHDALVLLGFVTGAEGARGNLPNEEGGTTFRSSWQPLFDELKSAGRACALSAGGATLWVATERLQDFGVEDGAGRLTQSDTHRQLNLREILRSRLEGLGPVTIAELGAPLAAGHSDIEQALLALEGEGFVLRGGYSAPDAAEWCERRLLARVHRYTVKRLRSEIEAVSPASFMRFLLHWQGLVDRGEGLETLRATVEQLEGFNAAAGAWESDILRNRVRDYTPAMLDELCTSGGCTWLRLNPRASQDEKKSSPLRNTPIALLDRMALNVWRAGDLPAPNLGSGAQQTLECLQQRGALFFSDLVLYTGMLRTQVEQALGELVNWGLVTADSFAGLRALVTPAAKRAGFNRARRGRRSPPSPFERAGRWSTLPAVFELDREARDDAIEHIAWVLLRRYGVVFRKLLEREAGLPPWRDLLRVYWRMEARGEIRGGRFVQSFSGEQFALPDAVAELRSVTRRGDHEGDIVISAADPLNLVGILVPGDKVQATPGNRILFRDGMPVACTRGDGIVAIGDNDVQPDMRAVFLRAQSGTRKPSARRRWEAPPRLQ